MESSNSHFVLASVVLVAPENVPQTYKRGWLESKEIFDEEMEIEQAVTTPPLTQVTYENGFTFEARENRTEIKVEYQTEESADERFAKLSNLGRYALNFAKEMKHLDYDAVGLNYRIAVETSGLGNVTTGLPEGADPQKLSFILPISQVTAKVQLDTGTLTTTGAPVVVVNGNFHHELPKFEDEDERYEEISGIVGKLSETRHQLIEIIDDTNL